MTPAANAVWRRRYLRASRAWSATLETERRAVRIHHYPHAGGGGSVALAVAVELVKALLEDASSTIPLSSLRA